MTLDPRHLWKITEGVLAVNGQPKTLGIGIGIEDGRVLIDTHGRASLDEDALDYLIACAVAAKHAARRQRERS